MAKIPYFPFFPDDWLSSNRIDLLTAEQERGYLRLLCRAWNMPECTLPLQKMSLMKWALLDSEDDINHILETFFHRTRKGYQNPKLFSLWNKAQERSKKATFAISVRYSKEKNDTNEVRTKYQNGYERTTYQNQNQNQNQNQKEKEESKSKPSVESSAKKRGQSDGEVLPDWLPKTEWEAFVEMRRRIKKPLTAHAVNLAVKKLDDLRSRGHPPETVLNQSIMACWQGLFEVKLEARVLPEQPRKISQMEKSLRILEDFKHGKVSGMDDEGGGDRATGDQVLLAGGYTGG